MDLKGIIVQALKNIIYKQTQMNMNSRFLFMRMLKEVNLKTSVETLAEMRQIKFVKNKSYSKVFEEMKKLVKIEEFRHLRNYIDTEDGRTYENNNNGNMHNDSDAMININNRDDKNAADSLNIDVSNSLCCANSLKTNTDAKAVNFSIDSETSICGSETDSYLERLKHTYESNFIYSQTVEKAGCEDKVTANVEDEIYSDSSIIICKQSPKSEIHYCEEDIFNSMSDLKLEDPNFKKNKDRSLIEETKRSKQNESFDGGLDFAISDKVVIPSTLSTKTNKISKKGDKAINSRAYTPAYKSVPYAIMKALNTFNGSHKHFVILKASMCINSTYEDLKASSAFKLLVKKQLIYVESDLKYYLTKLGSELCKVLFKNDKLAAEESTEIRIVIDSREKRDRRDRSYFQSYFNSRNITNVTRFLSLGDFLWLKGEKICKYIVERKQCTDFVSSISDGRYKEQKNRLSGLDMTVFYLIENLQVEEAKSNYAQRCMLEIRLSGFVLLETGNISESARVLEIIDKQVREESAIKNGSKEENVGLNEASDSKFNKNLDIKHSSKPLECTEESYCKTYGSFIEDTSKNNLKVSDMLLMALLGIKGLSKDFAVGLSEKYQSLSNFRDHLNKQELKVFKLQGRDMGDKLIDKMIRMLK